MRRPVRTIAWSSTRNTSPGVAVVSRVTLFGLLGPFVVLGGLARAGVTSWWLLAPRSRPWSPRWR
jgi:hypothetical protein